jgi:hypothetical protein
MRATLAFAFTVILVCSAIAGERGLVGITIDGKQRLPHDHRGYAR